jgi:hypothetical protein
VFGDGGKRARFTGPEPLTSLNRAADAAAIVRRFSEFERGDVGVKSARSWRFVSGRALQTERGCT